MLKLGTQNIAALHLGGAGIQKAYLGEAVVFGAGKPSRLPEGYTEVEYIQSSGTQYVATGVKPTTTIVITIDVEPLDEPTSTSLPICYSNYFPSAANYTKYILNLTWTSAGVSISSGSGTSFVLSPIVTNNIPRRMGILVDYAKKKASIVGEGEIALKSNSVSVNMTAISLLSSKPNYATFTSAKLYSCQIEIGGTATRDFVPCVDPSDAVGLYDLVEGKFYGNAGTGAFTAGPAV